MKVQKVLAGGLAVLMLAVSMPTGAREVSAETITEDRLGDITTDNTESDETANDDQTEAEQEAEENKEEETGQELEQTEPTEDSNLNESGVTDNSLNEEVPEEEAKISAETDKFSKLTEIQVSDGWYTIQAFENKGLCLDVISSSDKDGAEIQLYKSVFTLAQRFLIQQKENGWYTIQNISSNKYLGVEGDIPAVQEENTYEVLQWTGNGSEAQEFKFYQDEKGAVIIQVHEGESLVLDTETVGTGKRLKASSYREKASQTFSLKQEKRLGIEAEIEEGTYRIYPSQASGVSLDLWDASHKKGANIQLYNANGTSAQEWKISKQGSWYKITSAESSMALDVAGGKSSAGTNLQQWTFNSGKGQFFRFYQTGEGQYCIMSKLGTAIDCKGGSTKSKTNVQMYTVNGTAAQAWSLEKILLPAKSEKKLGNGYYTIASGGNTDLRMGVEDESNDKEAKIQLQAAKESDSQIFKIESQSDGWYMFKNLKSGKYLDVKGGDNTAGTVLQQYSKNSTAAQKFKLYDAGNEQYYLKSKLSLIVENTQQENGDIYIDQASCGPDQKWVIKKTYSEGNVVNVANGDYIISSGLGNSQVLDIKSGSTSSGANVQIYKNNKSMAQNFHINKESDGWYTIQNNKSKKYLDVKSASSEPKANLQQYSGNKTNAQKFKFYESGDGKYYIKSKLGTFVDVTDARSSSGTNVQMYTFNGCNAQKWTLTKSKRTPMNEWVYKNGYKYYYNGSGNLVKDVSGIIGKQSSYVIKVNKKRNVVTVYAKDGKKGYIIPVKSFICSTGAATPSGTFYTPAKYRWQTLMGPCYGQWCTRIHGGVLFHSVFYSSMNNTTLSVNAYNKLGTTCSHGCVRLTAGDAKWIYDNCKLKTKVIVYSSDNAGPFGKPTAYKLPSWHRWDPTDPNVKSKCRKKGCH